MEPWTMILPFLICCYSVCFHDCLAATNSRKSPTDLQRNPFTWFNVNFLRFYWDPALSNSLQNFSTFILITIFLILINFNHINSIGPLCNSFSSPVTIFMTLLCNISAISFLSCRPELHTELVTEGAQIFLVQWNDTLS